jgi:hypothetical protein
MTTISQKNIIPGVLLGGALATLHTAPALTRERITNATVTNDTAGVIALTVHIVPAGGVASAANKKIAARSISPLETYCCPELINRTLEPGDFIQALGNGVAMDVSAFTQS